MRTVIRYIVMLIALFIFGYAAYEMTLIYMDSEQGMDVSNDISNMFMRAEAATVEPQTNAQGETITMNNSNDQGVFVWDYDLLLSYNYEAKGYIRQENGEYIDNPILQHTDNDYYLSHLPNNTYSSIGSLFVDFRIEEGLNAKNPIVYGHCMGTRVNNIMFGSLVWYINRSGYADQHRTMDVYIGDKHYKYYVFACYETLATGSDTYQYRFSSEESFMEYVGKCKEKSTYNFNQEVTADDYIMTLSTCTVSDDSKRTIVQLVRGEEITDLAQQ